jgi:Flp pilus assembly protein TadB
VVPTAVILAFGLGAGCPLPVLGAVAAVALAPPLVAAPTLAAGVAVSLRRTARDLPDDDESTFLRAVSAELYAGATLRSALVAAADRAPGLAIGDWARRASAGRPLTGLADVLRTRLPGAGRITAAAIAFASVSGGASHGIFAGLAQAADDARAVQRERSVATAQVRLSALVVAAAPAPVLVWLALRGTFAQLIAMPAGRIVLIVGLGFEVVGVAATVMMLRRADDPDDQLVLLGDLIVLGLLAGMPFVSALDAAAAHLDEPLAAEVSSVVRSARLHGTGEVFGTHRGSLRDLLRLAARAIGTGAPLVAAIAGFTSEARNAQRARAIVNARRLAVRLLFPLALFILPGFIVLVAGPVVLDGVGRLTL